MLRSLDGKLPRTVIVVLISLVLVGLSVTRKKLKASTGVTNSSSLAISFRDSLSLIPNVNVSSAGVGSEMQVGSIKEESIFGIIEDVIQKRT